jgi:hypothetical protein
MTKPIDDTVGIIGDMHHPFCHPNYLEFVRDTFRKYGVTKAVCAGDEWDNCALSEYDDDPDGLSPGDERMAALESIQPWYKAFPKLEVMESNHGLRPFKKAMRAGIPRAYLRGYREFMQAPIGWQWHKRLIIKNVLYIHGEPHNGQLAAINAAKANRISTVIGHVHSYGGCLYSRTNKDEIFGLNVGCGIEQNAYAFQYADSMPARPTLGVGIVRQGKEAIYVPMG